MDKDVDRQIAVLKCPVCGYKEEMKITAIARDLAPECPDCMCDLMLEAVKGKE